MKNISKFFSILCCLFLVGTKLNALCNNPSDLDKTFGPQNNGIVTIRKGNNDWIGNGGILIDDQGRIVVSGTDNATETFAVARLLPNGLLDNSFNGNGQVSLNFGSVDEGTGGL